jgi:hypothetical protein
MLEVVVTQHKKNVIMHKVYCLVWKS